MRAPNYYLPTRGPAARCTADTSQLERCKHLQQPILIADVHVRSPRLDMPCPLTPLCRYMSYATPASIALRAETPNKQRWHSPAAVTAALMSSDINCREHGCPDETTLLPAQHLRSSWGRAARTQHTAPLAASASRSPRVPARP